MSEGKKLKKPRKGGDLSLDYGWVLHSQEADSLGKSEGCWVGHGQLKSWFGNKPHLFRKGKEIVEIPVKVNLLDVERSDKDKWWLQDQDLVKEPRDLGQGRGHRVKGRWSKAFQVHHSREGIHPIFGKFQIVRNQNQGPRTLDMSF